MFVAQPRRGTGPAVPHHLSVFALLQVLRRTLRVQRALRQRHRSRRCLRQVQLLARVRRGGGDGRGWCALAPDCLLGTQDKTACDSKFPPALRAAVLKADSARPECHWRCGRKPVASGDPGAGRTRVSYGPALRVAIACSQKATSVLPIARLLAEAQVTAPGVILRIRLSNCCASPPCSLAGNRSALLVGVRNSRVPSPRAFRRTGDDTFFVKTSLRRKFVSSVRVVETALRYG